LLGQAYRAFKVGFRRAGKVPELLAEALELLEERYGRVG
jgi:hypothetical protein